MEFWRRMEPALDGIHRHNIVWELLEQDHAIDKTVCTKHLERMKEDGSIIILDDWSSKATNDGKILVHNPIELDRLNFYLNVISGVKFDGKFVRAGLGDTGGYIKHHENDVHRGVDFIRESYPHLFIVAEHVDAKEIKDIFKIYDYAQGYRLNDGHFSHTDQYKARECSSNGSVANNL